MKRNIRYQGAILQNHHILLLKQIEHASGRSAWIIPGGGIEPDETEEACVQREMQEETSLLVQVQSLLLDEPSSPGAIYQRWKTYLCSILEGEAQPGYEPEAAYATAYSFTHVGWFDLRYPMTWGEEIGASSHTYALLQRIRSALGYVADEEAPSA